ncbi:OsmC family protein [Ottowia pentelensis]|uniref:OsmC family protein n=1 Tax=Ottowia pentelensis TaxID=511108 RepID=A0ABV6PM77_9BURK
MSHERIQESIVRITQYFADNPDKGLVSDKAAIATLQDGLACKAEGPNGATLLSDMPKSVGGGASAPTPGWFLRAALANCDATVIAMRAAQLGVTLARLEVVVDSSSDDRGIFGLGDGVPPGPQAMRIRVTIAGHGATAQQLRDIVEWAERHSPVGDAIRRAIPTRLEVELP